MSYLKGKQAEADFAVRFPLVRWATTEEDTRLHFDGVFLIWDREVRVDIKSHRSTNRGEGPGEFAWVELINVRGERGWLFGQADVIAFQYNDLWLLVERERLVDLVLGTIEAKISKEPFCLYRRNNRKDLIVMLPYDEIKKIAT